MMLNVLHSGELHTIPLQREVNYEGIEATVDGASPCESSECVSEFVFYCWELLKSNTESIEAIKKMLGTTGHREAVLAHQERQVYRIFGGVGFAAEFCFILWEDDTHWFQNVPKHAQN